MQAKSKYNETYDMPVLHYSELLALALEIDTKELALETHKIKVDEVISNVA